MGSDPVRGPTPALAVRGTKKGHQIALVAFLFKQYRY